MKTATKNAFTEGQIKALLEKYFPDSKVETVIPLSGGTFNTLYEIHGTGKLEKGVILKTGPTEDVDVPSHERSILQTEVYAYRILSDKNIPVPRLYAYDFSKEDIPCDFFVMDKIEGKTWFDCWPVRDSALMHDLGRYTAAMHSADKTWFGYIRWDKTGRFDTWGEAFTYMVKEAAETCREQGIKLPYEEIFYEVEERRDMLNELKTPSFVDFDMWAGNVFIKKEARYSISGIIDFERSFMGDPLASFSSALFLYDNVEKETAFLEGYNEVSRESLVITDKDREKMALYELLMYLRAYAEIRRYNFLFAAMQRLGIRLMIADLLGRLRKMKKKRQKGGAE